jgi:predicted GNAT family N-acyltransferase
MCRPSLDPELFEITQLRADEELPSFASDDVDLNEFLRDDAKHLQEAGVTRVYLARYEGELVGYAAVLTSEIKLKTCDVKRLRPMTHEDFHVIPAIKIGRLATSEDFKKRFRGCGTGMVQYVAYRALAAAEYFGCRLLIVDAYARSVDFYEKLGFRKASGSQTATSFTFPMWLDLHQEHAWL